MQELKPRQPMPQELQTGEYRFGRSRQRFRAPMPDLKRPYIACIGGSETYGRGIERPYPAILQETLGTTVANWGANGASASFFLSDTQLLEACSSARACVVAITPAHTIANRYFSVFPRRNARLKSASKTLNTLYPGVNFARFRYVHNLLVHLHGRDEQRFEMLRLEFHEAWIHRMTQLLTLLETPKILLWFSDISPEESGSMPPAMARHTTPCFISREMVEAVKPFCDAYVECVSGLDRQSPVPDAEMHQDVAHMLYEPITRLSAMTVNKPAPLKGAGWENVLRSFRKRI